MKLGHQSLTTKDRVAKVSDVPVRKIVSCLETFNILRTIKNFHIFVLSVNMLTPTNCSKKKPSVFLQSVREWKPFCKNTPDRNQEIKNNFSLRTTHLNIFILWRHDLDFHFKVWRTSLHNVLLWCTAPFVSLFLYAWLASFFCRYHSWPSWAQKHFSHERCSSLFPVSCSKLKMPASLKLTSTVTQLVSRICHHIHFHNTCLEWLRVFLKSCGTLPRNAYAFVWPFQRPPGSVDKNPSCRNTHLRPPSARMIWPKSKVISNNPT